MAGSVSSAASHSEERCARRASGSAKLCRGISRSVSAVADEKSRPSRTSISSSCSQSAKTASPKAGASPAKAAALSAPQPAKAPSPMDRIVSGSSTASSRSFPANADPAISVTAAP